MGILKHRVKTLTKGLLRAVVFVACLSFSASFSGSAKAEEEPDIPPSLKPWIPWVLSEVGTSACVQIGGTPACVWPSQLSLNLTSRGGTFVQQVVVGATSFHPLPGQKGAWPHDVTLDGKLVPVLEREGVPVLELPRGTHTIKGEFSWARVPEILHVGQATAFVTLSMNATPVPLIKREGASIWLKGLSLESTLEGQPEQVELAVFRQLRDGPFLTVETRLVFQVSGKAREITLDRPLLQGTLPLRVEGDLAVALEKSGSLRVQLVPGKHSLTLLARAEGMPTELGSLARPAPWPSREIWSWHPQTELRALEITGAPGIDASRTDLPEEWRADSAYSLAEGDSLHLSTTRRGQEQVPSNRLRLTREFWLDESAHSFTVRDKLAGEMHQGWRLDLKHGELGQVSVAGDSQVITQTKKDAPRGVEIRDAHLDLESVSRVGRTANLAAVGWSEDVDSLSATVHLPPGWDLWAATGVDETSDTWISRWNLFSVFYVLVLTFAMARLSGAVGGVVAAFALILAHEESGAPEYIWVLLVVLAALLGLIEKGRFKTLLRISFYTTGLITLVMMISFSVAQVRSALYPHLDADYYSAGNFDGALEETKAVLLAGQDAPSTPEPLREEMQAEQDLPVEKSATKDEGRAFGSGLALQASPSQKRISGSLDRRRDDNAQKQFQPDAIVQTGPGIPEVSAKSWVLNFTGPVVKDHQMRLYLLPPWGMRVLTVARLLFLFFFGYLILRRVQMPWMPPSPGAGSKPSDQKKKTATVLAFFLLFFLGAADPAHADDPSDARLTQLKERLTRAPACAPHCVSVSTLRIEAAESLTLTAEVHAGARAAYKLPGPAAALSSVVLKVNGQLTTAVRLESDGAYYLRLDKGVHEVIMTARLESERSTLDVGTLPERVTVSSEGWVVTGVSDTGQVEGGTLTFHREMQRPSLDNKQDKDDAADRSQVAVPPYFLVTRTINLGISALVTTHIARQSDASSPEVLKLPLLPTEQVTTPGIEVKKGVAEVPFPREATEVTLVSTLSLPKDSAPLTLHLNVEERSARSEIWHLQCGVVWHCGTDGITPTSHTRDGRALSTFHPWPGESLSISAFQPGAAAGSSLTLRKANLTLRPGVRMAQGSLEMAIQTSRATVHTVTIPKSARLESVLVDGVSQAVKSDEGRVRISLLPGIRKVLISWQDPEGLSTLFRSPQVDAGAAGVNFRVVTELPSERWLLLAGGPPQGPAILLWGYLVLILAAAWLLPRLPYAPLNRAQWVLLGLGLTQVPAGVALFVGGWFYAIGSRNSWPWFGRGRQNFLQFVLIMYSLGFLFALTVAVYEGLVSSPDMEVTGAGSYDSHLVWYADRSGGALPQVWILSLSIWVWRGFMLAWALWLSKSLLVWLRWAWTEMNHNHFWAPKPEKAESHASPTGISETDSREAESEAKSSVPPQKQEGKEEEQDEDPNTER